MNLRETYNKIADFWYKDHKSDDWWIVGTNTYCSLVKPSGSILDVGCGAGVKARYLSDKGFKVTGVDFSENLIEIARKTAPKAQFHVLDIRDVGRLGETYDGVFAQASLLHIPKKDIRTVLKTLLSVIKDGGYLYIAVKGKIPGGKDEDILKESDYGFEYERFFSYYTMEELETYLNELHITVVYKTDTLVGKTHWLQIVGKK